MDRESKSMRVEQICTTSLDFSKAVNWNMIVIQVEESHIIWKLLWFWLRFVKILST